MDLGWYISEEDKKDFETLMKALRKYRDDNPDTWWTPEGQNREVGMILGNIPLTEEDK